MPADPAQLCVSCVLVFSSFLALLCAAFSILISRDDAFPRPAGNRRHAISLFDILLSLAFIGAVTGLSLIIHRIPGFLALP